MIVKETLTKTFNTMEKILQIGASTNSDFDSVDYALITIDKESISDMLTKIELAKEIKEKQGFHFYNLSFWGSPNGWYVNDNILSLPEENDEPLFIDITDEQFNKLTEPESPIEADQLIVSPYGISWKAFGKYTGEEYWTDSISYEYLKELEKEFN